MPNCPIKRHKDKNKTDNSLNILKQKSISYFYIFEHTLNNMERIHKPMRKTLMYLKEAKLY